MTHYKKDRLAELLEDMDYHDLPVWLQYGILSFTFVLTFAINCAWTWVMIKVLQRIGAL